MDDAAKLAYQFGLELAKQLITLSTAIIGVSVTFNKDVFTTSPSRGARWVLGASWLLYLASIWFGVNHIQSLTGSLEMAAIERVALPDTAGRRAEREWGAIYLDTLSSDARSDSAKTKLAERGVLIGDSAKADAKLQIRFFFLGTLLAIVYGGLVLRSREKKKANRYVAE